MDGAEGLNVQNILNLKSAGKRIQKLTGTIAPVSCLIPLLSSSLVRKSNFEKIGETEFGHFHKPDPNNLDKIFERPYQKRPGDTERGERWNESLMWMSPVGDNVAGLEVNGMNACFDCSDDMLFCTYRQSR